MGTRPPTRSTPTWRASTRWAGRRSPWPTAARVLGVVYLKDIVKEGMRQRFDERGRMEICTVIGHGRQPEGAPCHKIVAKGRAWTTSWPRRPPRTRWR